MPVSYTHLDVYKRQALVSLRLEDGIAGGRAKADHGADGKDEVVDRQAEVEQGLSLIHI